MPTLRVIKISFCLYFAFLQGMCLSTLPGASAILKSPLHNALSNHQYGLSFLPQVVLAIVVTFAMTHLLTRFSPARILLTGVLFCAGHAMSVFVLGFLEPHQETLSFVLILFANACLGVGFGLLISTLNIIMVESFERQEELSLTVLHAVIGIGAALTPVAIQFFYGRQFWNALPLIVIFLFGAGALLAVGMNVFKHSPKDSSVPRDDAPHQKESPLPVGACVFLVTIALYGVIESMMGNWTVVFIHAERGLPLEQASRSLSVFWLSLTLGRLIAIPLSKVIKASVISIALPFILMLGLIGFVRETMVTQTTFFVALIGLGCSAFFPLTLGFAIHVFPKNRETLSSIGLTALMVGVGIGSSVLGFLKEREWVSLNQGFFAATLIAGALILFAAHNARTLSKSAP